MSERQPRISVVMVDGSFRERFESIDYFGTQTLDPDDYELIWVEYYDRVAPDLATRIARYRNFRTICLKREGTYHSSYCFNRGILEARGEIVVIPDADVIVEPAFLDAVVADHQSSDRAVVYYHRHNESEADHREPIDLDHLRKVCVITNPANHGACLSVRKRWLLEINGYDEHPLFSTGFHANDKDVYTRLNNLGLFVRWNPQVKLFHPWHPSTGIVTPHYRPQLDAIHWRGRTLTTLPFDGIDPSRNVPVPEHIAQSLSYVRTLQMTAPQRALNKVRRLLRLPAAPSREAA